MAGTHGIQGREPGGDDRVPGRLADADVSGDLADGSTQGDPRVDRLGEADVSGDVASGSTQGDPQTDRLGKVDVSRDLADGPMPLITGGSLTSQARHSAGVEPSLAMK